jgi:hypothetical protein
MVLMLEMTSMAVSAALLERRLRVLAGDLGA